MNVCAVDGMSNQSRCQANLISPSSAPPTWRSTPNQQPPMPRISYSLPVASSMIPDRCFQKPTTIALGSSIIVHW